MSLPTTGEDNWGTPLNAYITNVVLAQANAAAASISSHQAASDPHGDRAYALALVNPLTAGVNGPNGFLQLSNIGKIPNGVLPTGGGRTSSFDVVKDYSAPTNGTSAATQIQNALNDCGTAGGGEVWIGDGNFGIDSVLYCPSNVWLHLSPGATMTRLVNGGSGIAPPYMVANFNGATSGSGSGNILIEGGSWVYDSVTGTGVPMAFVAGSNILVRNTSVRTIQGYAAVLFAGCVNAYTDTVEYSTAAPTGARTVFTSTPPAVRIESAISSVISGLNSAMYTGSPTCNAIFIRGCSITGATSSDGTGVFTAFNGIAGTTAPQSGAFHTQIMVTGNTAIGLPYNGVTAANWKTTTVMGNQLNVNNGSTANTTWTPSAPAGTNQIVADNGASDSGGGAGTTLYAHLATQESRTGTSRNLDSTLQVAVQANTIYEFHASIGYYANSNSAGIQWDFTVPASAWMGYSAAMPGGVFYEYAGTPDNAPTNTANTVALIFEGTLTVLGTGGTFGFNWAQDINTPGDPLFIQSGSYISLTPVG